MPDPPHPEPASGAETAREIIACAERTLAAPSARIEWRLEWKSPQAGWPRPRSLFGKVLRERVGDVLWLVRLLLGATDASGEGTETLHGTVCRRLAAHLDMERASAATRDGLAPPQVDRFEDLRAVPVTAWIDGQHVRRVRFEQAGPASIRRTLDLWEFGVPVDDLDWSRLPTFWSPGYEQKPEPWYQRVLRRHSRVR